MRKQWNIVQRVLRQSGQAKIVAGVSIVFIALLVTGFAYAAALGQHSTPLYSDALNSMAASPAMHKPVAHPPAAPEPVIQAHATPTLVPPTPTAPPAASPAPVAPAPTSAPVAPTTQPVSGSYTDMIYQVFGSTYGPGAVNIAMCESSMNPNAYNSVLGASGLFQIIPSTFASTSYAGQSVFDPMVNIEAAHEIFVRDGYSWSEWQCQA